MHRCESERAHQSREMLLQSQNEGWKNILLGNESGSETRLQGSLIRPGMLRQDFVQAVEKKMYLKSLQKHMNRIYRQTPRTWNSHWKEERLVFLNIRESLSI